MKKRNTLCAAVSTAVVMVSMALPVVHAAGTDTGAQTQQDSGGYRFLVKYRPAAVEARDVATLGRSLDSAVARSGLDRAVVASTRSAARPAVRASFMRRLALPAWSVVRTSRDLDATEAEAFIRELKANPTVMEVSIDRRVYSMADDIAPMVPNDPDYLVQQWSFSHPVGGVRAAQAWTKSQGEGVVVAVVDNGVAQGNPDLQNNLVPGYDMITSRRNSRRDTDARVPGGWDVGSWVEENYCASGSGGTHKAKDSTWHGTHVAGTIVQETNNAVGGAGLAYKAKVLPVRVLGSCGGYTSDVVDGMIWAVGGQVPGLPINPNPAEVINMSMGVDSRQPCSAEDQEALDFVTQMGAIVVVAAGNNGREAGWYPMSNCDKVISVGATRITGGKASYSNYGARVDLSAPGGDKRDTGPGSGIWQMINGGTKAPEAGNWALRGMLGTSMASPHVAAAVAMVQSVVQTPLTWKQMRRLLMETASPFPVAIPAATTMGTGILNIDAALTKALADETCSPGVTQCGPLPLVNKVAVNGLADVALGEAFFSFQAEAGKVLSFMSYGGTGEVLMHVGLDDKPTAQSYEARSVRAGSTSQTVRFTAPKAGRYYVRLVGVTPYSGVSLVARQ